MNSKNILSSKTLWANVIAIAAMLIQSKTGFIVAPEYQEAGLGLINIILRLITKQPVTIN